MNSSEYDSLYLLLNSTMRHYYLRTHELLETVGLHPGQPRVLHALSTEDGLNQKEIGEKLNIKPSTVTVMINRMEKAELVKRVQDKKDLRVSKIYLQQKGIDLKDDIINIGKQVNSEIFKGFSEKEKENIKSYLERISENLKK